MGTETTRHVAVGTAGHIDHGKTTLVKRLTGVDTDRLPEERRRGITIALGFAPLQLPSGTRVSLIDVPGHERFVKTMVAGAGGLDVVLLVVAADEGVMPQTREHLEICQLLGIERAVVALTKIDKAGPELTAMAKDDLLETLRATRLGAAACVPCSAITGEGIDALLTALDLEVARVRERRASSLAALPIDRVFSVHGFGSVVTGTLRQGSLSAGETVEVLPPVYGRPLGPVKIRGLEVFKEKRETAHAGDRVALNLQGADAEALAVGQVVARPGTVRATRVFDAELFLSSARKKALKSGARAVVHAGTAHAEATVTLLDADAYEPGQSGFVRLRLRAPLAVVPGERFILRGFDLSGTAGRTAGGGVVLDVMPGRRRRLAESTLEVMTILRAYRQKASSGEDEIEERSQAAERLIAERGAVGLSAGELKLRLGLEAGVAEKTFARLAKRAQVADLGGLAVAEPAVAALGTKLLAVVDAIHAEHPFRGAIPLAELASKLKKRAPEAVVLRALSREVGMKKLAQDPEGYRRPDHAARAEVGGDARTQILAILEESKLEPPLVGELAEKTKLPEKALRELLAAMSKGKDVIKASPELYFSRTSFEAFQRIVLAHLDENEAMSAQDAKAKTGLSRKYLIPLLEALDKAEITVRVGDVRKRRRPK
ncbi:MAG: selenocysteine-specific translation elongation factor [Myxococcota bacterium]